MIWALLLGLPASWASVLALTPRAFRSRTTGVEKEWGRGPRSEGAPQDENRRVIEWPGQRGWGVDLRRARQMTWTLGRNTAFDFWMCWSRRTTYIPEWKLRAPRVEHDRSWADYKFCGLRISLAVQWLKLVQELRSHMPDSQKNKTTKNKKTKTVVPSRAGKFLEGRNCLCCLMASPNTRPKGVLNEFSL